MANKPKLLATPELNTMLTPNRLANISVTLRPSIKLNITLQAGDILSVSTGYGEKEVTLQRDGVTSDAFRYLDVDSTYFQLSVGDNLYRYSAEENLENLEVSIYHDDLYLGV